MTVTTEEAEVLIQFRKQIEAEGIQLDWYTGHDDNLVRWLRARDMNVEKAVEMFKTHSEWRERKKSEGLLSYKFPETITDDLPFQLAGFDAEGCPVVATPFGKWDLRKFVDSGKKQLILDYIEYLFEIVHLAQKSRSTPSRIHIQAVLILDYEGFSLRQMASRETIDMVLQIIRYLEANQPETLKLGCIVNAPRIFELFFRLCKPLLTTRTLSKIQVFGPNADEWKNFLRKNIPHTSIPSYYGGSNTSCFNYKFTEQISMPITPNFKYNEGDMETIDLQGGQRHSVAIAAQQGKALRWAFCTDRGEINFQLENAAKETVIDISKIDAHTVSQYGSLACTSNETYNLYFENPSRRQDPIKLRSIVECVVTEESDSALFIIPDSKQVVSPST